MRLLWTRLLSISALGPGLLLAASDDAGNCGRIDEVLTEIRQLRALVENKLSAQPAGSQIQGRITPTRVEVGGAPFLGSINAPFTIVEFTDFQCPYCSRFFEETFPDLKKNYIDSGKLRFYSMDLPLEIHSNALLAARAGRCAADQGQFWAMHDRMQGNPTRLEVANLVDYAQQIGIDVTLFRQCVDSGKYTEDIQRQAREATAKGALGTPAFVVGKSIPAGVEGELVIGAEPYSFFEGKLKSLGQ
jgi:protein-disulfide isomerase